MAKLVINETDQIGRIEPEVYGHFSEHLGRCIYEGIYVGEDSDIENVSGMRTDVVEALKEMKVPVLRWPGGCFADEYHWMDGIGPKENRKKMINTHWGGVLEDNSFGTHEYMELCRQLGCKTYVNGNLGSGTVQEMSEWVEYMTYDGVSPMAELRKKNGREKPWKVDFFGIGNENWGCGGNMTPQYYANEYRRYQTYVRHYDKKVKPIQKVCCGANVDDYYWTDGVLSTCFANAKPDDHSHGMMDYLSLHYYVHPEGWRVKGSATKFDETTWYKTMYKAQKMDELVTRHGAIMDRYDPDKKIGLSVDEWGAWYNSEPGTNPGFLYQQNTIRDALIACITLNVFNKHCDRVKMAALAQMVNVLQAPLLTEGDQMIKTPTYYVMHMYRHHQSAQLLQSSLSDVETIGVRDWRVKKISESVSLGTDGVLTVTLGNLSPTEGEKVDVTLVESGYQVKEARIVTADDMHAYNSFDEPDRVLEADFTDYSMTDRGLILHLPPCSVAEIRLSK